MMTLSMFVSGCTNIRAPMSDCPNWINHVMPIMITKDERDNKLSHKTLRQLDNQTRAWERYCKTKKST